PLCSSLSPISLLSHATPTSEFYTLSLHDALPIYGALVLRNFASAEDPWHPALSAGIQQDHAARRSQSPSEDVLPHRVPHLCPFRSRQHRSKSYPSVQRTAKFDPAHSVNQCPPPHLRPP